MEEITEESTIRCAGCGKSTKGYLKKRIRCPFCGCKVFTLMPKDWFGEMKKYILETVTLKEHRDFLDNEEDTDPIEDKNPAL